MLVRVAAAKVISRVIADGISLNACLPEFSQKVPDQDQALLSELCYGTLRHYPTFGKILTQLLDKPLKNKDQDIVSLLACALYQLSQMRIPSHAVVNESVATCKALKRLWAKGLVNALLRRFIREREVIENALADDPEYKSAHPQWLIDLIRGAWPNQTEVILQVNNQRAPMTLRVNARQTNRDQYLSDNFTVGSASACGFSAAGIQLIQPKAVSDVPGFEQGVISVQDEAAQLAAPLLDVQAGQRVLDACCAPGGKTCHILELAPRLAELVAIDIDAQRLEKVRENLARLKLSATLVEADVADSNSWWDGVSFDRVLLDAPCSATGVIRRHPDIKLLRKPEDIAKLAELQLSILTKLWAVLSVGGKLLYATCSVLPQENDDVVKKFIHGERSARLGVIETEAGFATDFGRQLLPMPEGHDGFYYAMLEKT